MNSDPRSDALDKVLASAAYHRRKGDLAGARRALDDAKMLAPNSAAVFEEMGQLDLELHDWKSAERNFRAALAIEPGRQNSEIGLGNASLEAARHDTSDVAGLAARQKRSDEIAHTGLVAAWMSLVVPGLGQFRLLEFGRGGVALGCELAFFVLWGLGNFGLIAAAPTGLPGSAAAGHAAHQAAAMPHIGPLFWVGLFVLAVWHITASVDAARLAKSLAQEELERL